MSAPAEPYSPHGLRQHVHLLKIHQPIQTSLIPLMRERHILQQQWHERYNRRLQFAHTNPIRPVIPAWINHRFKFGVEFPELRRQFLPSERQSRNCHITQAHYNGAKRVQILVFLATVKYNW